MKLSIDMSRLTKGLNELIPKVEEAVTNSLMQTGYRILDEAEPLAPIDEATLIGSGYVQVGKEYVQNPKKIKTGDTPPKPMNSDIKKTELRVGYTVSYAEQLHENPFKPGIKSEKKGLTEPAYKWLINAANRLNIKNLFNGYLKDELKRL